jgi:hypothetical protein
MPSPTERTLAELRKQGMKVAVVEKYNAFSRTRHDLFGIVDILALDFSRGFVGVQCTGNDFAGHMKKLTEDKAQECIDWLRTPGGHLEIWAWRKVKVQRGGKVMVWSPRIKILTLEDFFEGWDSL